MERLPLTAHGYATLQQELEHRLKIERPRTIEGIAEARKIDSDPSESPEVQSAQQAQETNEARIAELSDMLARAEVIDPSKLSGNTVTFGATVVLRDEDTGERKSFQIVGEPESDLKRGRISCASPVARSLLGQKKGASVEVVTPGGSTMYEIKQLRWQ